MGSPVTFVGAADVPHCSSMVRAQGVNTVRINGQAVSCHGHTNSSHLIPVSNGCATHTGAILTGSSTVRASGLGVGRVGDTVGPVCTSVGQGSPNVFAG